MKTSRTQKNAEQIAARRTAARRLHDDFYAVYDRSLVEDWLGKLARGQMPVGLSPIGGGFHFQAYVSLRLGTPVVIKRATGDWADRESPVGRKWRQALAVLRRAEPGTIAMIPPFELIEAGGAVGLVMPYAAKPWRDAAEPWLPLPARLAEMATGLADLGLALDDVEQGGLCDGVPVVYDLSDLRPL